MKNIYRITKGQLVSLWIFGLIGWLVSMSEADYSGFATFLAILIPALLIFYTLGWRHNNKIKLEGSVNERKILNLIPSRKKVIRTLLILGIVIALVFGITYLVKTKQEALQKEQLKQKYDQAISSLDNLKTQFTTCIQPTIDKKYQEELRSCNLLKGKIKNDYNFCVSLSSINSPASCLYDYDYESIDCSQETIERKAKLASINNIPTQCSSSFETLMDANDTIKEYSNLDNEK